ncbi:RmlC-like cupin domain-containing protein [Hysterangium stoloniferum]|nr:RmlC-like cupin domain-containing protein [Hysterangium stoloniferum]
MSTPNDAIAAKLLTAANQNERIAALKDSDFVFNFLNATPTAVGQDGMLEALNPAIFPALLAGNGAITVGLIGPCGLNTPHVHPRGTEININVGGGDLLAEFIQENNARVVKNVLSPGMATVFPRGAIHFEQNLGCTPVTFIASFDFVDPGVSQVAVNLFKLDQEIVRATFNNIGVEFLDKLVIPPTVALGAQTCFDRCKIDRKNFKFNGTFADFFNSAKHVETVPSEIPYQAMTASGGSPNSMARMLSQSFYPSQDIPFAQNPLRTTVMGLSAALVTLILFGVFVAVTGKRRQLRAKKDVQHLEAHGADMVKAPYCD